MAANFLAHCRSSLENADCPWVVQMPDSELENWLFKPGPQHTKALIWALTKIDPELQEHFCLIQNEEVEKDIVKLCVCLGFVKSSEPDKVLGHASRKMQESFWNEILYQLSLLQDYEDNKNPQPGDTDFLLKSLMSSSNFWVLIDQKPNLIPSDIAASTPNPDIAAKTLEELKKQLAEAEEALCDDIGESDSFRDFSNSCLSSGSRQQEERIPRDLVELVRVQRNKIDDCYKKFFHQVAAVIEKHPPNPAARQLAQMVANLHGKVQEFYQFMENADKIKRSISSISNRTQPENFNFPKNSLLDFIATMERHISIISAELSANNDLFG